MEAQKLENFINGKWMKSKTDTYVDIYNPSTGEVIARSPNCTKKEADYAVVSAQEAYKLWKDVPVSKRVQILFQFKKLIDDNFDDIVMTLCKENGKTWEEAKGDVSKAREGVEFACGMPSLIMGESVMDITEGYDTVLYRESIGVFLGIAPFNFPAMIPIGWMAALCIAAGNTMIIKAANITPMTSLKMAALFKEAGLPDGVLNVITCDNDISANLIAHQDIKGITFVGSERVGRHIYNTGASHGKRVQALCAAKNHALVLKDAQLERTAKGIINAAFGCAGERCMALPVVVVEEEVADNLVGLLVKYAKEIKVGVAYNKESTMGPVISEKHRNLILNYIDIGVKEGAKLILDGRDILDKPGFYLSPTIFDYVTSEMTIGTEEIFGPVLSIKRVKSFEEGLHLMNSNQFANGSTIYTASGYYSRRFARETHGGMVGINVGIPVPMGVFPFTGHKNSFFGDLHCLGKDGLRFYTETKAVTTTWFDDESNKEKVDTWDGML